MNEIIVNAIEGVCFDERCTLRILNYLTLKTTLWSSCNYFPHCTDEETEAQRGYITCFRSVSEQWQSADSNPGRGQFWFPTLPLCFTAANERLYE